MLVGWYLLRRVRNLLFQYFWFHIIDYKWNLELVQFGLSLNLNLTGVWCSVNENCEKKNLEPEKSQSFLHLFGSKWPALCILVLILVVVFCGRLLDALADGHETNFRTNKIKEMWIIFAIFYLNNYNCHWRQICTYLS